MHCRLLLSGLLAIFLCSVEMKRPSGRALKRMHGDGNEAMKYEDNISKIAQSLDNLGRSLEYLIIADVNTNKALKLHRVLKYIPQVSALLSAISFALKTFLIVSGSGNTDSPMVKKMKTSFNEVNKKLDTITSDLKINRDVIKLAAQRAAYINAENKILVAYESFGRF